MHDNACKYANLEGIDHEIVPALLNFEAPPGAKQPAWPRQGSASMSPAQDANALPQLLTT